jgi:hypothetical protein
MGVTMQRKCLGLCTQTYVVLWQHISTKYFITFIDDFSWKFFFNTMKTKFGMLDKLKAFKSFGRKLDWKGDQM